MSHFFATHRCWVEIDTAALAHDARTLRQTAGCDLLAVVKANAYGHGVGGVVQAIDSVVGCYGVANVREAAEVRRWTARDVMILGPCLPFERQQAVEGGFVLTVSSAEEVRALREIGPVRINFKIDTGMGRVGVWHEHALEAWHQVLAMPGVEIHSVSTHLPSSDEDEPYTRAQLAHFREILTALRASRPDVPFHMLNSAGILRFSDPTCGLARAGLALYGVSPVAEDGPKLRPALTWKTCVTLTKTLPAGAGVSYGRTYIAPHPVRIAVLAAGYADGYPRQISGKGACVLIGGRRCPILGRVTMDQTIVDISHLETEVKPGDEVVLLGRQGEEELPCTQLASWADTIAWDVLTGISPRVDRVFVSDERA